MPPFWLTDRCVDTGYMLLYIIAFWSDQINSLQSVQCLLMKVARLRTHAIWEYASIVQELNPCRVALRFFQYLFLLLGACFFPLLQTGSGKTYTMGTGYTVGGSPEGVIPQVMQTIFKRIEALKHKADFQLRVSFIEVRYTICSLRNREVLE